jgi:hypothetical protein
LLKLTDGQSENAKIKGQNAKLRNPASVGMGVLIVALVGISGQIRLSVLSLRGAQRPGNLLVVIPAKAGIQSFSSF